jgi:toxin secretion/phage lysis holin
MEVLPGLNVAPFAFVLAFIVFDVVSGLIKGGATGTLSSQKMRNGLWHKSALILLEAMAALASFAVSMFPALPQEFGAVYVGISVYIIAMEVISILENISIANPELANGRLYEIFGVNNSREDDWKDFQ